MTSFYFADIYFELNIGIIMIMFEINTLLTRINHTFILNIFRYKTLCKMFVIDGDIFFRFRFFIPTDTES